MKVYRISRQKFAYDLSGKGAEINSGRWNSKGNPMLYTAATEALSILESLVHIPRSNVLSEYVKVIIEIPDSLVTEEIDVKILPDRWTAFPFSAITQNIGDEFIRKREHLAIKVPSVFVRNDWNILINPKHKLFSQIKILEVTPYSFDPRLLLE